MDSLFRFATAADLHAVDCLQRYYRDNLGFLPRQALAEYIRQGCIELALDGGEAIAYLLARIGRPRPGGRLGRIFQAAVHFDLLRNQVGSVLLRRAIDRLRRAGAAVIHLWCARDLPANAFWDHHGFVPVGWRYGSFRNGRIHLLWELNLVDQTPGTEPLRPQTTNTGNLGAGRVVFPIQPGANVGAILAPEAASRLPAPLIHVAELQTVHGQLVFRERSHYAGQ